MNLRLGRAEGAWQQIFGAGGRVWRQRQAVAVFANSLGLCGRACAMNRYFGSIGGMRAAVVDHAALMHRPGG